MPIYFVLHGKYVILSLYYYYTFCLGVVKTNPWKNRKSVTEEPKKVSKQSVRNLPTEHQKSMMHIRLYNSGFFHSINTPQHVTLWLSISNGPLMHSLEMKLSGNWNLNTTAVHTQFLTDTTVRGTRWSHLSVPVPYHVLLKDRKWPCFLLSSGCDMCSHGHKDKITR